MSVAANLRQAQCRPLQLIRKCGRCRVTSAKQMDLEEPAPPLSNRVALKCACGNRWLTNVKRGEL